MSNQIHRSLNPKTGIVLIFASMLAVFVFATIIHPFPIILIVAGLLLGGVSGILQSQSITQSSNDFKLAKSSLEVRQVMARTRSGKAYIRLFWAGAFSLFILSQTQTQPVLQLLVGYFSMLLARETLSVRATLQLQKV